MIRNYKLQLLDTSYYRVVCLKFAGNILIAKDHNLMNANDKNSWSQFAMVIYI